MKNFSIVGNWKLYGNKIKIQDLLSRIKENIEKMVFDYEIVIVPPTIYLDLVSQSIKGTKIKLGAQNVDIHLSGSYTGEVSAEMLGDFGVKYTIIGHSERRYYHNEDCDSISKKFQSLRKEGIIPIYCIGESKEEKEDGRTKSVCSKQIHEIVKRIGIESFKNTIIAYEPVWAVGTGISETPENIQEIHSFIKEQIYNYDKKISKTVLFYYGGSVKPDNVRSLFHQKDINGILIGQSSTNADTFLSIIKSIN